MATDTRKQIKIFYGRHISDISQYLPDNDYLDSCLPESELTISHLDQTETYILLVGLQSHLAMPESNQEHYFMIGFEHDKRADLVMPFNHEIIHSELLRQSIAVGLTILEQRAQLGLHQTEVQQLQKQQQQLKEVAIALSAEKDLDVLLEKVLREGMVLGNCEAASIYLVTERDEIKYLSFKKALNSVVDVDYEERTFELNDRTLAGYVAQNNVPLHIEDAYNIPESAPYQFDTRFDKEAGYRCRDLLILPMNNHKNKTIGVLQFINCRDANKGFDYEATSLLSTLASQSAVAIDNSQLIENIQQLFEGFVNASVKAIEARDPVTSGHSFRVAELTTSLAQIVDELAVGKYKDISFSEDQIKEIRYASLLHDFGKVGVREPVLLKSHKLYDARLRYLELKLEWQKQRLERNFYEKLVHNHKNISLDDWHTTEEYAILLTQLDELNHFQKIILEANQPTILESNVHDELNRLSQHMMDKDFPFGKSLISDDDFLALSVQRGSLTNDERNEIQSHVVHSQEFLSQIPWTDELKSIPSIAGAHHEKLDGSGYPHGLKAPDIPLPSKIMTITDIFDALTAQDRPYKKSMKSEIACNILHEEAQAGKVCSELVEIFTERKIFNCLDGLQ